MRARQTLYPTAEDFAAPPGEEIRSSVSGRAADIFFASTGPSCNKWVHYLPIYDQLLGPYVGTAVRMLEIGVQNGGSQALWRKYLGDRAILFGIDIDAECARHNGRFSQVRIGSQADPAFLERVVEEMGGLDVVLDDGSHMARHQRISFETLFPLLSEGGAYAIEDLHTAYWPQFEGGLRRPGTAIEMLKDKIDDMHRIYRHKGLNTDTAASDIESVQLFDSIAIVRKRKQHPRHHVVVP